MMQTMAVMTWISVCVLVFSSAIPTVKRVGVNQTDGRYAFTTGDNEEIVADKTLNETIKRQDRALFNKTDDYQAVPKTEVLALVNRLNKVTPELHMSIRLIYDWYTQENRPVKDIKVISAVRENLVKDYSFLKASNKIFVTDNETEWTIVGDEITKRALKDDVKIWNVTTDQDHFQQKKQKQTQQKDENNQVNSDDEPELAQSTDETVFILPESGNSSSVIGQYAYIEPAASCQHVPGFYEPVWLQIVVTCPSHWQKLDIKNKCESWENLNTLNFLDEVTFLPVQGENGVVYANVYCATCNELTFFLPWTTSFICSNTSPEVFQISEFTNLSPLYLHLLTSECERYIFPSIPEAIQECERGIIRSPSSVRSNLNLVVASTSTDYPISFNVLMNFDFTGNTHILFTTSQTVVHEEYIPRCTDGHTYDPYAESCRQITCNKFYTLQGNKCVRNGNDSSTIETITDLSQLRTVNIVTLQVNITFQDFLIMKFKGTEPDIIPQIAEHLNISVDRFKDVNITYEFGSINGSALHVTTLTEDEYLNIFLHNQSQHMPKHSPHNAVEPWPTGDSDQQLTTELPEITDRRSRSQREDIPRETYVESAKTNSKNESLFAEVDNIFTLRSKIVKLTNAVTQNAVNASDQNETITQADGNADAIEWSQLTNLRKPNKQSHPNTGDHSELSKEFRTNINLLINKKLFQQVFKYRDPILSTENDTIFRFHFKSQNEDSDLYISAPVNDNNDRISLILENSQNIQRILQESMIMRISFALVPPANPFSNEAGSITLLQKIDKLIYEQQFSLKLNGNEVDVVAVSDDRNKTTDEKEFCPWGVEYMVYDDEFMMITVGNSTVMYVNKTNSYIGIGLFDLFIFVSGSNNAEQTNVTHMMQYAFVCFMPRIIEKDCNMINLEKNEYYFTGTNKSIVFENKVYDIFMYRVLNTVTGSIQICVPPTFNNEGQAILPHLVTVENGCSSDFDEALEAEGYMTLVLGRISMFALCCVFLTYLILPPLRNLPGINTMNLTFCLLVTQVIFAEGIGENRRMLCEAVAISLHYSLLAAHFWMNVISYDVYKTFTTPIMNHAKARFKYFPRYALYAWGTPFIIVSICVFVDFSNVFEGVSIGYGGVTDSSTSELIQSHNNSTVYTQDNLDNSNNNSVSDQHKVHTCWITQPLAALIAFGAIILIIFFVNIIFFVKTIVSISRTAKIAKKSLATRHSNSSSHKMTDHSEVMLYVRMSTVMGFTWVFGLSSSLLSSFVKPPTFAACAIIHFVGILFIILNTSQGFFIFVAFVCNRRVFGLYKDCLQKTKNLLKQRHIERPFATRSSRCTVSSQSN